MSIKRKEENLQDQVNHHLTKDNSNIILIDLFTIAKVTEKFIDLS